MKIRTELSYASDKMVIVKAICQKDQKEVGTAHGQALSVEEAEDIAISRVLAILARDFSQDRETKTTRVINSSKEVVKEHISDIEESARLQNRESETDAKFDWTSDLDRFQEELDRLNWSKEDESQLVQLILGLNNKNKITNYNDITLLIALLKSLSNGTRPNSLKMHNNREYLVNSTNTSLQRLNWDLEKAKEELYKMFKVHSRTELTIKDLLRFELELQNHLSKSATNE